MSRHGGNIYRASKKFSIPPADIIDFSANINPLGLHWNIKELITNTSDLLTEYPDPDSRELTERISSCNNIHRKNIICGNGSASLIYLAVRTLKFKKALIVQPNFSEYENALKGNKAEIRHLVGHREQGFKVELEKIIRAIEHADCLFLSSPNNPVGYLYTPEELLEISRACKHHKTYLFIDECFIDFVENFNHITLINRIKENPYILVLRSLTKFYAIPGIRLGFLAGHREIVKKMKKYQEPWPLNRFAQEIGKSVLGDTIFGIETRRFITRERDYLIEQLSAQDELKVYPSAVNYLLCEIISDKTVKMLSHFLAMYNILIRDCSNYRGLSGTFFRIAVKRHRENELLVTGLNRFFQKDGL